MTIPDILLYLPSPQSLALYIQNLGMPGVYLFLLGGVLSSAVGVPRQVVALIAGYSFHLYMGLILAVLSTSFGALLTYYFSKKCAKSWAERKLPKHINRLNQLVQYNIILKIIIIRLLPFGTNMATNLAAGCSTLSAPRFFIATFIGFIPQAAVFTLAGNGISIGDNSKVLLATVLFSISVGLALYIYKKQAKDSV